MDKCQQRRLDLYITEPKRGQNFVWPKSPSVTWGCLFDRRNRADIEPEISWTDTFVIPSQFVQ